MDRPSRSMPSMAAICAHRGVARDVCLRCGEAARCERAHLIDRCDGGLDQVQNLVPLCRACHGSMPPFRHGEDQRARLWLASSDDATYLTAAARAMRALRPHDYLRVLVGRATPDDFVRLDFDWQRAAA